MRSTFQDNALGAVIAGVWQEGKPIMVGALGDSLTGVPATVDMHHIAGNVGEAMMTTVLLQQVEAGKLALTDRLSKWYPALPSADAITVDMLAHSTSGYQHYTQLEAFQKVFYEDPFRKLNTDEVIAFGVAGGPLYPPGTSANFSDTNFLILTQVLEKATGRPLDQLTKEGILDPLGTRNTTPPLNGNVPEPVLHSYVNDRNVWEEATFWDPSWTGYAGGWRSNQDDLRRIIEAVGTGELLSKASHEAQLAPTTVGLGNYTPERYYAMGVPVVSGWVFSNPGLQGLRGAVGTLAAKKLTIAVYNTATPRTDPDKPWATILFQSLSEVLAPDQPLKL